MDQNVIQCPTCSKKYKLPAAAADLRVPELRDGHGPVGLRGRRAAARRRRQRPPPAAAGAPAAASRTA